MRSSAIVFSEGKVMTQPYLNIEIIQKQYSKKNVLQDINIQIEKGEVIAIMGPSGGGKTTLARCLAGFESFEGKVVLDNKDISKLQPKDRSIGIVPQDGALFPHLNVFENVAYGIKSRTKKNERVHELLTMVHLEDLDVSLSKRIDQLSGGQQQRVAVARALGGDPKVIILDESFSALDQWLRISVRREILKGLKAVNATVIVITHDVSEAFELADRVAVLEAGHLVQFDTVTNLYTKPDSLSVAQLVGNANIISYNESQMGNDFIDRTVSGSAKRVLMVRPENVTLTNNQNSENPQLKATISDIRNTGPLKHYYMVLADTNEEIIGLDSSFSNVNVGDVVSINISKESIIYSC